MTRCAIAARPLRLRHPMPKKCRGRVLIPARGRKKYSPDPAAPLILRCRREGSLKAGFTYLIAWSCHHAISCYRSVFGCAFGCLPSFCVAASAEEAKNDVKGLFLLTDYPAVTLRPGPTSTDQSRACRTTACRPSGWRCRSPACRRAGPRPSSAAASRSRRRCRRPTPACRSSFASTCRRMLAIGTTNLTVNAPRAPRPTRHAAGRGHAGDRPAGQAHAHAAAARTARHLEVDLRVPARDQERERQEGPGRASSATGAAEFRRHLHRAVRQPGAQRAPARSRPVEGRQAQGAAAEHGRAPASTRSTAQGHRRGRHRHGRPRPRHHRPAEDRHRRPRRRAQRAAPRPGRRRRSR